MDRFDLELKINYIGTFSDNLRLVSKELAEEEFDLDKISNALEGIAVLLELHEKNLHECMCQIFELDAYRK